MSGHLHAPADLPPWKSPWYPLYRKLCGSQTRWREEKNLPLPEIETRLSSPFIPCRYFWIT